MQSSLNSTSGVPARGIKRLALLALATLIGVGTTSCTSDQVAVGLGAGAIGVIIGSEMSRGPRCSGGYRTHCSNYYDRWGNNRRQCREYYDSCARRYRSFAATPGLATENEALHVASKYQLSYVGAEKFVNAIHQAKAGDVAAVTNLGLSNDDMVNLASLKMISDESAARVANSLDTTTANVRSMVTGLTNEARTQFKDINSPLWKACTEKGQWSTPQNTSCSATHWNGCSPATGATMCAAI